MTNDPNADLVGLYWWDWHENADRTPSDSYVVRRPDGRLLCFTDRTKRGYEDAVAIAAAMNEALAHNDRSEP